MVSIPETLRNENGSVIVVAMIMLVLLTLIGISSTNTSSTEVQIAANNQNYQMEFYLADSGWRQGAMWLENSAAPPEWVNADNDVKLADPDAPDNSTLSHYQIPYWYAVAHLNPDYINAGSATPEGNEKGYERFYYEITSTANGTQEIQVRASKIYKVGY